MQPPQLLNLYLFYADVRGFEDNAWHFHSRISFRNVCVWVPWICIENNRSWKQWEWNMFLFCLVWLGFCLLKQWLTLCTHIQIYVEGIYLLFAHTHAHTHYNTHMHICIYVNDIPVVFGLCKYQLWWTTVQIHCSMVGSTMHLNYLYDVFLGNVRLATIMFAFYMTATPYQLENVRNNGKLKL